MNLRTIAPHQAFLDALAAEWLARAGDDPLAVADGLILLPTRRAARALAEAFLAQTNGRPLLLPRIAAVGALDEAPLALSGALTLAPAVPAPVRLAHLTRLVMALDGRFGAPATADHAWPLAVELAALMDEAERAEIDLAEVLPGLAAEDYATHWGITLEFLRIVTRAWPDFLAANGQMNPAARQVALLDAQAASWTENPPTTRVLAAGTTGGIPAVARLLRVVAGLPRGEVVLPGLDLDLPDESWTTLEDSHPQAGLRRLLTRLGATRGDVQPQLAADAAPAGRTTLLHRALLPAPALAVWRDALPAEPTGLSRLAPADQQEEALAIALILRGALEMPDRRAALVTPDRDLAGRVAVELGRFGIVADDSAGETLAATPPAVFLRLLAEAVANGLRPVPLLALLKHPLAAAGLSPADCRAAARALEREGLRGPAPQAGIAGLRGVAKSTHAFIDRLETCLAPLLEIAASDGASPVEALTALIAAAEALASTPDEAGPRRLWSGEDGQALAALLGELLPALEVLPVQPPGTLPGLLDAAIAGVAVRSRRALRGRDGVEHPRVFIWGLLEARLQRADVLVLGGLAETMWPAASDPGPWMSRPMRAAAKLPSPEEAVGQMAHDWVMTACAAPEVVFSCPLRRDGAPAVPARWLQRLDAMLRGAGQSLPEHPAALWARQLDQPNGAPPRLAPPAPRPALEHRPRILRVTEIETWLRDPYAIYARRILNLQALPLLEEPADAADYGTVVHAAVHAFLREVGTNFPANAETRLVAAMDAALDNQFLRPALAAWWRPRLRRIATWLAGAERDRRLGAGLAHIASEKSGDWPLRTPLPFSLKGRADRIERRFDGSIAILDYKTGTPPSARDVLAGLAPQLLLEAAMAADGAFGDEVVGRAVELTYWHLTGGFVPGEIASLFKQDADKISDEVAMARSNLTSLVATFDNPDHPYLSQPHPGQAPRFSDYTQLARVAEWAALEEGE
ncbi:double-strand break repair protein AddB [Acidisphaera sp. L21]|uniref:double-strand break repair protein AddB n=1 Tax=Acidisphaera sp. L21 TaxID=1641851 RepID=UPI00131DD44E|nr:double-strand break repair protein AddB [Acidisphaera sp. L21]